MQTRAFLVFSALCLMFVLIGKVDAKSITKVKKVFFSGDNLLIDYSGKKPETSKFNLKSSQSDYTRLVVDLKNSKLVSEKILGSTGNKKIKTRLSQFSQKPSVVRVVFEGPKSEVDKLKIFEEKSQILIGKTRQSKGDKKPVEYKLSSINKVDLANGHLSLKGNYGIKKKIFKLNVKNKKMVVADLKKANLSSTQLAKSFSEKQTNTSEKIRVAQFEPGTVRVVVEGPESDLWQFDLKDRDSQLHVYKSNKNSSENKNQSSNEETESKSSGTKTISAGSLRIENGSEATTLSLLNLNKSRIKYKYFQLHSPERLVLDLYNWTEDPQNLIPSEELSSTIIGVRVGRPTQNNSVARIVFDLSEKDLEIKDSLSSDKRTLFLKISTKDKEPSEDFGKIRKNAKVIIDAGHGGYDSGAHYSGTEEKILSLEITKKVEKILKGRKIEVVQTRKDDRFVSLDERVEITKRVKPDLFVSIHCNAMQSTSHINGIETYYFTAQSHKLAKILHKHLVQQTKAPDRRVRKARFVVIRETSIPSVLLEVGFLSNYSERKKLKDSNYQNKIAKAVSDGILEYLKALKN
ncbi:MAG: N-acetylmuramoyl-L-alanine amidase [Candidatus Caenarcaniphilales bacterium]|nr:N-acetylmuramoyl-L-alanine amidase [Candidatus Caenarcaniphilales bacterium]